MFEIRFPIPTPLFLHPAPAFATNALARNAIGDIAFRQDCFTMATSGDKAATPQFNRNGGSSSGQGDGPGKVRKSSIIARVRHAMETRRWRDPFVELPDPPMSSKDAAQLKLRDMIDVLNPVVEISTLETDKRLATPPPRYSEQEKTLSSIAGGPVVIVTGFKDLKRFGSCGGLFGRPLFDTEGNYSCNYFIVRMPDGSGRLYVTTSDMSRGFDGEKTIYHGQLEVISIGRRLTIQKACISSGLATSRIAMAAKDFMARFFGPNVKIIVKL